MARRMAVTVSSSSGPERSTPDSTAPMRDGEAGRTSTAVAGAMATVPPLGTGRRRADPLILPIKSMGSTPSQWARPKAGPTTPGASFDCRMPRRTGGVGRRVTDTVLGVCLQLWTPGDTTSSGHWWSAPTARSGPAPGGDRQPRRAAGPEPRHSRRLCMSGRRDRAGPSTSTVWCGAHTLNRPMADGPESHPAVEGPAPVDGGDGPNGRGGGRRRGRRGEHPFVQSGLAPGGGPAVPPP